MIAAFLAGCVVGALAMLVGSRMRAPFASGGIVHDRPALVGEHVCGYRAPKYGRRDLGPPPNQGGGGQREPQALHIHVSSGDPKAHLAKNHSAIVSAVKRAMRDGSLPR